MTTALVLHSGGIDSTTCLYLAKQTHSLISLSIRYNSKHNTQERKAAEGISALLSIPHYDIQVPEIFGQDSTLMDPLKKTPQLSYAQLRASMGPSPTYVPFRNGVFLSIAVAFAMNHGAKVVYFGAHADDAHNYAYPDTTPEFFMSMRHAVECGTYRHVTIAAPFLNVSKSDVIREAAKLGVPFSLTYSCYEGRELHCGLCPTCVSRIEAFSQAKIPDPTKYENAQ